MNRIILGVLAVGAGLVGVALLATHAGPTLHSGVRLSALAGTLALAASLILFLRVSVAVMRDGVS